jgi:hypothetical protein
MTVRIRPVPVSVAVTVTFAIAAPDESVTVPLIAPVDAVCALAPGTNTHEKATNINAKAQPHFFTILSPLILLLILTTPQRDASFPYEDEACADTAPPSRILTRPKSIWLDRLTVDPLFRCLQIAADFEPANSIDGFRFQIQILRGVNSLGSGHVDDAIFHCYDGNVTKFQF